MTDLTQTTRESALYRAIIMQAIEDLFDPLEKSKALRWINSDKKAKPESGVTFIQACEFGELDARKFRYIASLINEGKLSKKEYQKIVS